MLAIDVQNVSKIYRTSQRSPGLMGAIGALIRPHYKEKVAVENLSFQIEPGELVGFIGVNGAGKSTTIKMLTGILIPSSGSVKVLGRDPHRQRVDNAREIGVVFGQRTQMWWDLALIESLNLIAKIYEIPKAHYKLILDQFVEELELKPLLNVPIRNLSLGQKMRAELAASLIHEPKVIYLDEPTIGLDIIVKERIRAFIRQQNRIQGTTVMLTTHDLNDIEEVCKRIIIIDAGKVIYDGSLLTIKDRFGMYREISFEAAHPIGEVDVPAGAMLVTKDDRQLALRFDRRRTSASKVASSLMAQFEIVDFTLIEPDLSTIVKQIYQGALREEVAV